MLQQVQNIKCLCCDISNENGKDSQKNLARFAQILGILNNNFKQISVQIFSRIKNI